MALNHTAVAHLGICKRGLVQRDKAARPAAGEPPSPLPKGAEPNDRCWSFASDLEVPTWEGMLSEPVPTERPDVCGRRVIVEEY